MFDFVLLVMLLVSLFVIILLLLFALIMCAHYLIEAANAVIKERNKGME